MEYADTTEDVRIRAVLSGTDLEPMEINMLCVKLHQYRVIDELHQLNMGRPVRWIRRNDPAKLTAGGIAVDIRFTDNGTRVFILGINKRVFQINFDECILFQKCTFDELLVEAAKKLAAI